MAYSEGQKYWIWLSSVYGLGARRFDELVDRFGPPQRVWEEFGPHLLPLLGQQAYAALCQARSAAYFDGLFESLNRCGAVAVARDDPEYPALLRQIPDAPPILFVRGRAALPGARTLAVVGSRNATAYGTRMARRIARGLSEAGVTVVSGLARGVDGAAHRGAVDARARTVAVLGSGVDVIYPPEHLSLTEEILNAGGSLVSEFPPGAPPRPAHFPARNRVISGLSLGVLLVEGAKQSGAMSTVRFALEQGREVLAMPGQADSPLSASTHALIRDGARLVTSAAEILEDMGWAGGPRRDAKGAAAGLPLTGDEQRIYSALSGGPADPDALVELTGMAPSELNSHLTILELQGLIRKLPGRKVERVTDMEE